MTQHLQRTHRLRKSVASLALFCWLHLVLAIYPLPLQRTAEIEQMSRDAVASQAYLGMKLKGDATSQAEWNRQLTQELWRMWIRDLLLLITGTAAAIMAL